MDIMDCRSPSRCPSCEHWQAARCVLEEEIALALAPRPMPILLAPRVALASS